MRFAQHDSRRNLFAVPGLRVNLGWMFVMERPNHIDKRILKIAEAVERGGDLMARIKAATSMIELADLMAEAIAMDRAARADVLVGHDGRARVSIDTIQAAHCMDAAREAYLKLRQNSKGPTVELEFKA